MKVKKQDKKKIKKENKEKNPEKIEIIRVIKPDIEIIKKTSKKEAKEERLEDFLDDYEDFSNIPKITGFQKTSLEQSEPIDNLEREVEGVPVNDKSKEDSNQFRYELLKSGSGGYIEATGYTTASNRGSYETANSRVPQIKPREFTFVNPDFEMNKENDKYDHHKHYSVHSDELDEESPFKSSKEKKRRF